MNKTIKLLLIGLILFSNNVVYAETIIDSKNVTYSNSKTKEENVKGALDELIDTVDNINSGGDADSIDITEGKTAIVKGKLITGTRKNNSIYFEKETSNRYSAYLDNKLVTVELSNVGGFPSIYMSYNDKSLDIKTCTKSSQDISVYKLMQISPYVVVLYWGFSEIVKDTDTITTTNYYDYITSFIVSDGELKKVAQTNVNGGSSDLTNYSSFIQTNSYSYTDTSCRGTDRTIENNLSLAPISFLDPYNVYFNAMATYEAKYQDACEENSKDYEATGYWFRSCQVNTYTGAISSGQITTVTSKHFTYTDLYDSVNEYGFTPYGIEQTVYNNTAHDETVSYKYLDYYGNSRVNITANDKDNSIYVRDLPNVYHDSILYAFDVAVNYKDSFTIRVYSSSFGSNTTALAYFLPSPAYRNESLELDLSDTLPSNVKVVSKEFEYYNDRTGNYYYKFKTTDDGYLFLNLGFDTTSYAAGSGLKPIVKSVTYRKKFGGKLISKEKANISPEINNNIASINFYR